MNRSFKLWLAAVLPACSFALFAACQLVRPQGWHVPATLVLAFAFALYWVRRTGGESMAWTKRHMLPAAALLGCACIWAHGVHAAADPLGLPAWGWLLYVPALWLTLLWACRSGCVFFAQLWQDMDASFRRVYMVVSIVAAAAVVVCYAVTPGWYLQYDQVYSIDSSFCMDALFSQAAHYDIRHPVLSLITYPLYAVSRFVLSPLPAAALDAAQAVVLQLFNAQMLVLIGVMIGLMARSVWTSLWYYASLPTLLFALSFEKYQLCIFLLAAYAYRLCRRQEDASLRMVMATGAMPTSVLVAANELFIREPLRQKLGRFARMALIALGYLVCTGRVHLLDLRNPISEMRVMTSIFSSSDFSFTGRLLAWEKMLQGCFVSVASTAGDKYFWTDLTSGVSVVSMAILVLVLLGVWVSRKERFGRLCTVWLLGSFALLVVFRWGVFESPLFSIYFSWALIPLCFWGMEWLAGKCRLPRRAVHAAACLCMLAVNAVQMADIARYLHG